MFDLNHKLRFSGVSNAEKTAKDKISGQPQAAGRFSHSVLFFDRVKGIIFVGIDAHWLMMYFQYRNDMCAVLFVEVIQIRNVLEVVCINFSGIYDCVRNNIVIVFLDIQSDALFCQDVFCDC